jgi:branched-chain amino acid transport system substrate-binding protein
MIRRLRVFTLKSALMFLLGLIAYLPSQGLAQTTATGKPILIGVHGDYAKQASYYTLQLKAALDAFVEDFNAAGGIKGRPVKILFEDDENNPVVASTKVEKLASQGVVFIISIGSSATGFAAQAKAEELKIPIGAPANVAEDLSNPVRKYYFRISMRNKVGSEGIVIFLKRKYGNPKIAVVRDATETGLTLSDDIIRVLRAAKLNLTNIEQITPGSMDVTAQAVRVKEAKPDVVVLSGGSIPDLANYVKTHKAVGNPAPMVGTYVFNVPAFPRLAGDASDGFVFTDSVDFTRREVKQIEEKLIKKLGEKAQNNPSMIHSWEFTRLVADAIKRAGSDDRQAIRDAMERTKDWPIAVGSAGNKVTYSPSNHDLFISGNQVVFREVRGGKVGPPWPTR